MDNWERKHRANVNSFARKVDAIYQSAVREAAAIGVSITEFSPDKPFSFSDYPSTRKRIDKLLNELKSGVSTVILNGVDSEWTLANNKNNELCNVVFGDNVDKLTNEQQRRYYRSNGKACDAFKARKTAGLNLSDRVWNYSTQFKAEIEMGLDLGLRDGLSADDMSRELRSYLKYPDKLFRRVRDEHGQLHLSKAARAFNPGQGVYRSSYKNAMRLTRTETNMAYRTSDYVRAQQLDFVVGIEVHTSNNHPKTDICDSLAGKYPKDFKFVGWHPQCRCYVTSILKTPEEMQADNERIMRGELLTGESTNKVDDVPQQFKQWTTDNKKRLTTAKSMPYFVRDNEKYFPQMRITDAAAKGVKEAQGFNEKLARISKEELTFKPASSIAEIDSRMKNIGVDNFKMSGITLDEANTILEVFEDVSGDKGIHIENVIVGNGITKARAVYTPTKDIAKRRLEINANIFKQDVYKEAASFEKRVEKLESNRLQRLASISGYEKRLGQNPKSDKIWAKYISEEKKKIRDIDIEIRDLNKLIESGRLSQIENVTSLAETITEQVQCTIRHELAHYIDDIIKIPELPSFLQDKSISLYGETDIREYFAEWFSYYKLKGATNVPADVMKYINIWENKGLDNQTAGVMAKAREVGNSVQSLAERTAKANGGVCTPINYKGAESIKRKVLTERKTNIDYSPKDLKDAVRTTIVVPRNSIDAVINDLKKDELFKSYKPQLGDKFIGYTGNIVNINTSNGLVAEIQVNTAKMIYAKESPEIAKSILGEDVWNAIRKEVKIEGGVGHKYYEEYRLMTESEKLSPRGLALKKKSEEYYSIFTE